MDPQLRKAKLKKRLAVTLEGRPLAGQDHITFLEAICNEDDAASCISRIAGSPVGLAALHAAMSFDTSPPVINSRSVPILTYLQIPELTTIDGGNLLKRVLLAIVEPPTFWSALVSAFKAKSLVEGGESTFAWLLLRLCLVQDDDTPNYRALANDPQILDPLLNSTSQDIRGMAEKIRHICSTSGPNQILSLEIEQGAGGRHDNDFIGYRDVAILPTPSELQFTKRPFLRTSGDFIDIDPDVHLETYLDNHFRLLREDMVHEMREEMDVALGVTKGKHRGFVINGMKLLPEPYGINENRRNRWGLRFRCENDLWQFNKDKPKNRLEYLKKNPKILRHNSLAALLVDGQIVAFPNVHRDEDLLARKPPVVILQLEGDERIRQTVITLKTAKHIQLIQIDTAVFAYEPVLKALQAMRDLPLKRELLYWKPGDGLRGPTNEFETLIRTILESPSTDLRNLLRTSSTVRLDASQGRSLIAGLTQSVSLVQGPPGTGKSFIGALLAKAIHLYSHRRIFIVCYTNHALDQFLEDLISIGIPPNDIVRLGGNASPKVAHLTLQKPKPSFSHEESREIDLLRTYSSSAFRKLERSLAQYLGDSFSPEEILAHLRENVPHYADAFLTPKLDDESVGMQIVGEGGHVVDDVYLMRRWMSGKDASSVTRSTAVWKMTPKTRKKHLGSWKDQMVQARLDSVCAAAKAYTQYQRTLDAMFTRGTLQVLRGKRIIAATTTGAAKFTNDIQALSPEVVLVEEAGEILESHILTALGPKTKQLIMIGDHKQLRPKVNHYLLTVEKGDGYDLNQSLFERLILKGYPHEALTEQHRMRPQISTLVRELTYPELRDAAKTQGRPKIKGVQDVVVFVHHEHPEDSMQSIADKRDADSKGSKQNTHEVRMVLKILRYLVQQGYGREEIVILTPYLGQLHLLQNALKQEKEGGETILNELDSQELGRAGLLGASSKGGGHQGQGSVKRGVRLATIDNYQGEESDIVIASLTRSNPGNDIGFMSAPERLNVLLSRARNGLILIGNMNTFKQSRKGKELWTRFFDLMVRGAHIYHGFPIQCEQHPLEKKLLTRAEDFDEEKYQTGGCERICGAVLNCGIHTCLKSCHKRPQTHDGVVCDAVIATCSNGHTVNTPCHEYTLETCATCIADRAKAKALRQAKEAKRRAEEEKRRREAEETARVERIKALKRREEEIRLALEEKRRLALQEEIRIQKKIEEDKRRDRDARFDKLLREREERRLIREEEERRDAEAETRKALQGHADQVRRTAESVTPHAARGNRESLMDSMLGKLFGWKGSLPVTI